MDQKSPSARSSRDVGCVMYREAYARVCQLGISSRVLGRFRFPQAECLFRQLLSPLHGSHYTRQSHPLENPSQQIYRGWSRMGGLPRLCLFLALNCKLLLKCSILLSSEVAASLNFGLVRVNPAGKPHRRSRARPWLTVPFWSGRIRLYDSQQQALASLKGYDDPGSRY